MTAVDPAAADQLVRPRTDARRARGPRPTTASRFSSKADDNHWKIGDVLPVTFVKTGIATADRPSDLRRIAARVSATTSSRSRRSRRTSTQPSTSSILAKLEARRDRRAGSRPRSSRCSSRTRPPSCRTTRSTRPTRKQHQPGREPRLRAVVPRGDHRVHRHREHAGALDLRANARDRAAARGRHEPRARCAR